MTYEMDLNVSEKDFGRKVQVWILDLIYPLKTFLLAVV